MSRYRVPKMTVTAAALLIGACAHDRFDDRFIDWRERLSRADTAQVDVQIAQIEYQPSDDAPPDLPRLDAESGPVNLSIEQAVALALEHHPGLAAQRLGPAIAGTFERIELARFDPVVFAELDWRREQRTEASRATGENFDVSSQGAGALIGISQRLATGTDLELTAHGTRAASNRAPDINETRLGVSLNQALLAGASPAANLARVRQARLEREAGDYELRGYTQALIAQVERTYWQLVLAQEEIRIFEEGLQVARQLANETRQRIEVGVLAEQEQAAADAEVALRTQELINARSRRDNTQLALVRLIRPEGTKPWEVQLDLTLPDEPLDLPDFDIHEHVKLARLYRPELNEARLRLDQNRLEVVRTENGLLPRLDMFIRLGKTGFADSFGSSVGNLDRDTYDLSVGLRFEYPWGRNEAEGEHQRAVLTRMQSAQSLINLGDLVELEVRQSFIEVGRAYAQIAASAATRRLREQTLAAETERLAVGTSTAFQVAQAQRDLLAGRIAEVEARINYRIALIELYRLDGTLLQRRGIDAPGAAAR